MKRPGGNVWCGNVWCRKVWHRNKFPSGNIWHRNKNHPSCKAGHVQFWCGWISGSSP